MFGQKAKRIAELEAEVTRLERELEETQVMRNTFEFALINSREGRDEETNAFFRDHPVYVQPEQVADAGAGTVVATKTKSKKVK